MNLKILYLFKITGMKYYSYMNSRKQSNLIHKSFRNFLILYHIFLEGNWAHQTNCTSYFLTKSMSNRILILWMNADVCTQNLTWKPWIFSPHKYRETWMKYCTGNRAIYLHILFSFRWLIKSSVPPPPPPRWYEELTNTRGISLLRNRWKSLWEIRNFVR